MLGAGVFVAFGPGYQLAGQFLFLGIILAGVIAYLNAASIAQLASVVTRSGGAYAYARHYLNNSWGFVAGFSFLLGKIGSAAAIALTFANYLFPTNPIPVALAAVVVMTAVNIAGVNRTALGSKILGVITLLFLLSVIVLAFFVEPVASNVSWNFSFGGILSAAAIFFFAFAGYARVATLGGEVKNSARSIPFGIRLSLAVVFLVYLGLGILLPWKLGAPLADSITPIADLMSSFGFEGVWLFASIASLGSLLALMAGMGRTAATMAEDGELPAIFSKRNRLGAPWLAETVIAGVVLILISIWDPISAIGLSSFCILLYYAIANLAAFRQPETESTRPKSLNILGLGLCLLVGFSVPFQALISGALALVIALALRLGLAKFG